MALTEFVPVPCSRQEMPWKANLGTTRGVSCVQGNREILNFSFTRNSEFLFHSLTSDTGPPFPWAAWAVFSLEKGFVFGHGGMRPQGGRLRITLSEKGRSPLWIHCRWERVPDSGQIHNWNSHQTGNTKLRRTEAIEVCALIFQSVHVN